MTKTPLRDGFSHEGLSGGRICFQVLRLFEDLVLVDWELGVHTSSQFTIDWTLTSVPS